MILESIQILSTVSHLNGMQTPYRPSHQKHPCVVWTGQSLQNWLWLRELVFQLQDKYLDQIHDIIGDGLEAYDTG